MNRFNQFILWSSGADIEILNRHNTEKIKYWGIGATVFFTGILAAISASNALYYVYENWFFAIAFGLLWGTLIFNLDRFLVSSITTTTGTFKKISYAIPRLLLAVFIGLIISKPIEIKLFEKEIKKQKNIDIKQYTKDSVILTKNINYHTDIINDVRKSIKQKTDSTTALDAELIGEIQGRVGSGISGDGPAASQIRQTLLKYEKDILIAERKITLHEKALDSFNVQMKKLTQTPFAPTNNGLISNIYYIKKLKQSDISVTLIDFFLTFLFILIEILPVLTKLLLRPGSYDNEISTKENFELSTNLREHRLEEWGYRNKIRFEHERQYLSKIVEQEFETKINIEFAKNEIMKRFEIATLERQYKVQLENSISDKIPFAGAEFYIDYKRLNLQELNELMQLLYKLFSIIYFVETNSPESEYIHIDQVEYRNKMLFTANPIDDLQIVSVCTGNSITFELANGWKPSFYIQNSDIVLKIPKGPLAFILTIYILNQAINLGLNTEKLFLENKKTQLENDKLTRENTLLDIQILNERKKEFNEKISKFPQAVREEEIRIIDSILELTINNHNINSIKIELDYDIQRKIENNTAILSDTNRLQ